MILSVPVAVRAKRPIDGISAVLMPFTETGAPDIDSWTKLVERTWTVGLTPAINMDTGYANLLSAAERRLFFSETQRMAQGRRWVGGVYIEGVNGNYSTLYPQLASEIRNQGGTPILFPSTSTAHLNRQGWVQLFRSVGIAVGHFLGFELSPLFVPFGRIWDLETFKALMLEVPEMIGVKHSSLSRELEWERLKVRDTLRPEFRIYTGNDLAIDMVQWGSDYLLGLSAFHVEAFVARDRLWELGDSRFYELNDWLQYLGMLAFRHPVPAYKHSCAQFLALRGLIPRSDPHPNAVHRPNTDIELLRPIVTHLDRWVETVKTTTNASPANPIGF